MVFIKIKPDSVSLRLRDAAFPLASPVTTRVVAEIPPSLQKECNNTSLSTVWVEPLAAMSRELHAGIESDLVTREGQGLPSRWHTETAACMFDTVAVCHAHDSFKLIKDDAACVNVPGNVNGLRPIELVSAIGYISY